MISTVQGKTLRKVFYALTLFIVLAGLVTAASVQAQGPTPSDDDVNRVAKQLYCPVCESTPLDVCPTEACRQWRDLIRQMLADGKSEAEIKQYFVEHFGARVLNEPPNRFLTYVVPVIAFLAGVFILVRGFQMWLKPAGTESAQTASEAKPVIEQDEYIQKMEEELKRRN